jgi:predicted dinucleotide-binding enzyme
MKIGIIGAGAIGVVLAKKLLAANYEVEICNSRGPASLKDTVAALGERAKAVDTATAADNEVVILALRWVSIEQVLKQVAPQLSGKILIDTTNPVINMGDLADLHGTTSSELVASYIPDTKVVKAFNTLKAQWLTDSLSDVTGNRVIFTSGAFDDANATVSNIISDMGFSPIVLGNLAIGGAVQQYGKPLALKNLWLL